MQIPAEGPVVVGAGGTATDPAAVRFAAREAVSRGRTLTVVHAFTWPGPGDYALARRAASRIVEEAVSIAQRSTPGIAARGHLVDGPPERVLLRLTRSSTLLVLGGGLVEVVLRAWCPVAVARRHRTPSGPVLAAVDGSPVSAAVLRFAAEQARRRGGRVDVVYAGEPAGRPVLDGVRPRLLSGDPAGALVHASRDAGLIVLGPRGPGTRGRLGTVAAAVLRHGGCPAVFVHGPAGFRNPGNPVPELLPLAHT
ncbi:universal stress protein [Actinoplanes hulinensis]|uniref:Universal stress protein n=1 Tax=Actinoplanes hulinensis TaxID=1144547 RepID=A0ABS7B4H3_9ACTN|nr:universal stress protein [Actinoplanes hulinensis]MBW6435561.1 universal stress protein [Actinoplanes hulinensis]